VPTDDDLTLLGAFPTKMLVEEFERDRLGAIERFFAELPDAPDLSGAERASKAVGTSDYPMVRRPANPRPGLALVGDAATTSDPVPAVGCTWAFCGAEWLADSTVPALQGRTSLRAGLRTYEGRHRFIARHDRLIRADARGGRPNPAQRAIRRAAVHDPEIASRLGRFSMRAAPVSVLVNPATVARAIRTARRSARSAKATTSTESSGSRPMTRSSTDGGGPGDRTRHIA
jgi:2-polyprenyl-6-methoxyphenol hydroxylase-like FAD-dependent oxidoreductase